MVVDWIGNWYNYQKEVPSDIKNSSWKPDTISNHRKSDVKKIKPLVPNQKYAL